LGILAPAVVMGAFALNLWLSKVRTQIAYLVLGLFLSGMLSAEVVIDSPLYHSWYNLIHI
jgi:hypothetical protein